MWLGLVSVSIEIVMSAYIFLTSVLLFHLNVEAYSIIPNIEAMSRILHGSVVDISDHPYQVALVTKNFDDRIVCGGALVKPKVVFTAAHCTHIDDDEERPNLSILVGANSLKDPKGKYHEISKVIKHPDFSFSGFDNDFSIVVLKKPVAFSNRVQKIPVSKSRILGGSRASVSGWGITEFKRPSEPLRAVDVVIEKHSKCQDYFPRSNHPEITGNMICIKPGRKGTSFGDSGSPLVIDGELVGLVSFGRSLGKDKKVTVFTRVKNFIDFAEGSLADFR